MTLLDAIYMGLWSLEWDENHYKICMDEYVPASGALWRALRLAGVEIDHWNMGAWNLMPQEAEETLVTRLRKRAEVRRQIPSRKSVQEGKPDRLADLLDEAADAITDLISQLCSR